MQELKLRSVRTLKSHKLRPVKSEQDSCINNLKELSVTSVQTHVCTNITYIYTLLDGWVYQLTFMDLITRKILHYTVSDTMAD